MHRAWVLGFVLGVVVMRGPGLCISRRLQVMRGPGLCIRRRLLGLAMAVAGLAVVGLAVQHPLKAAVGHELLSRTFAHRIEASFDDRMEAANWRPWPGADLVPIAELHFPRLDERRVVADSASGEALAWSVGHMPGTALPGEPGVSAVAGHRDGRFALLSSVVVGDVVELTTLDGETNSYVISAREVVDSTIVTIPVVHDGPEELLLTTCWPIDGLISGPERLVVRARPVSPMSSVE